MGCFIYASLIYSYSTWSINNEIFWLWRSYANKRGETENVFLSEKTYLTIFADGEIDGVLRRKRIEDDFLLSENTNNKINIIKKEWNFR